MKLNPVVIMIVFAGLVVFLVGALVLPISECSEGEETSPRLSCDDASDREFDEKFLDLETEVEQNIYDRLRSGENLWAVIFIGIALITLWSAVQRDGLLASSITLVILLIYYLFVFQYQIDQPDSRDLQYELLIPGWAALIGGATLMLIGGIINLLMERSSNDDERMGYAPQPHPPQAGNYPPHQPHFGGR